MSEINSLSRVLQIMLRLLDGEELFLQELNTTYGKHNETIKKDIAIIRNELMHKPLEIQYSRSRRSYKLIGLDEENSGTKFSSAIVVLMVMYGCRGLSAEEVKQVEHFITGSFAPSMQQRLKKFASSYRFHYKPILKQPIFAFIELAFQCITRQQMIRITYTTIYHETQYFDIMPYTLIYDEGYFYLIAEPAGSKRVEGNIFRIDQISHYEVLNEPFTVQQHGTDYFKPGEFANHTFFMHYGESTMVIRLRMRPFIESYFVAKFPVHQLIERGEEWLIYECTVMHGESALFWIFSERHWVELLSPSWLRERVKYFLAEMLDLYRD